MDVSPQGGVARRGVGRKAVKLAGFCKGALTKCLREGALPRFPADKSRGAPVEGKPWMLGGRQAIFRIEKCQSRVTTQAVRIAEVSRQVL
ncbi:hypothetical protein [Acidovorax sp. JHL-9]|uniref:hypothetical protein n=1 Tax=Acidovorax sp. JHL-9 TaxID=1276756 RepID=UPI0012DD1863|nr:hypothetical protein [Acidovorax sp. JHL-9]